MFAVSHFDQLLQEEQNQKEPFLSWTGSAAFLLISYFHALLSSLTDYVKRTFKKENNNSLKMIDPSVVIELFVDYSKLQNVQHHISLTKELCSHRTGPK